MWKRHHDVYLFPGKKRGVNTTRALSRCRTDTGEERIALVLKGLEEHAAEVVRCVLLVWLPLFSKFSSEFFFYTRNFPQPSARRCGAVSVARSERDPQCYGAGYCDVASPRAVSGGKHKSGRSWLANVCFVYEWFHTLH
jgi:hypothetical protein